jgi:hypothetical protein
MQHMSDKFIQARNNYSNNNLGFEETLWVATENYSATWTPLNIRDLFLD